MLPPRVVAVSLAEHEAPGRLRRLLTRRGRRERGTRRSIERLERVVHCSIHRDLAPAPVLGLLEQQDAAGEVDVLPDQSEDLPFPHARVEGDRDNREQIWALTSPPFCRVAGPRFAAGWPESITSDQSPRRPRLRALPRRAPRGGPPVQSVAGDLRLRPVPRRKTRAEPPKRRRTTRSSRRARRGRFSRRASGASPRTPSRTCRCGRPWPPRGSC